MWVGLSQSTEDPDRTKGWVTGRSPCLTALSGNTSLFLTSNSNWKVSSSWLSSLLAFRLELSHSPAWVSSLSTVNLGLVSLHDHRSQFLITNLFIYVYFRFSGESWLISKCFHPLPPSSAYSLCIIIFLMFSVTLTYLFLEYSVLKRELEIEKHYHLPWMKAKECDGLRAVAVACWGSASEACSCSLQNGEMSKHGALKTD